MSYSLDCTLIYVNEFKRYAIMHDDRPNQSCLFILFWQNWKEQVIEFLKLPPFTSVQLSSVYENTQFSRCVNGSCTIKVNPNGCMQKEKLCSFWDLSKKIYTFYELYQRLVANNNNNSNNDSFSNQQKNNTQDRYCIAGKIVRVGNLQTKRSKSGTSNYSMLQIYLRDISTNSVNEVGDVNLCVFGKEAETLHARHIKSSLVSTVLVGWNLQASLYTNTHEQRKVLSLQIPIWELKQIVKNSIQLSDMISCLWIDLPQWVFPVLTQSLQNANGSTISKNCTLNSSSSSSHLLKSVDNNSAIICDSFFWRDTTVPFNTLHRFKQQIYSEGKKNNTLLFSDHTCHLISYLRIAKTEWYKWKCKKCFKGYYQVYQNNEYILCPHCDHAILHDDCKEKDVVPKYWLPVDLIDATSHTTTSVIIYDQFATDLFNCTANDLKNDPDMTIQNCISSISAERFIIRLSAKLTNSHDNEHIKLMYYIKNIKRLNALPLQEQTFIWKETVNSIQAP